MPVIDMTATGQKIKQMRTQAGMTIKDMQEMTGVSASAVTKWQRGESMPSIDNLVILAAVLDVSIDEILVYDEDPAEDISAMKIHDTCLQRVMYRQ